MGRIIYVYLNDEDLSFILALLSEKGIVFYDKGKTIVDEVQAISNGITIFYMSHNKKSFIEFTPCFYTLEHIQCASFRIESEADSELFAIFALIKKHIRQTCLLSQDKTCYIDLVFTGIG